MLDRCDLVYPDNAIEGGRVQPKILENESGGRGINQQEKQSNWVIKILAETVLKFEFI
jgi:hypothetical protein